MKAIPARMLQVPALTGLRAVAAAMVFFYHWLFDTPHEWALVPRAFVAEGHLGVAIFFALSGFLITVRYRDDLRDRRVSAGQYLIKRFARIYPVYFVVLTLFVVALGRPIGIAPTSIEQGLMHYTLTQAFFPALYLTGVSTAWTLTIEELFYFGAPVLMRLLAPGKRSTLRRAALVAAALAAAGAALAALNAALPVVWPQFIVGAPIDYTLAFSILGRLPDFLVGMLAALIFLNRERWPALTRRASAISLVSTGLLALFFVAIEAWAPPEQAVAHRALSVCVAASAAGLILGLACDEKRASPLSRLLGSKPLEYAGRISYVLYLIQLTEPLQYIYWIVLGGNLPRVPHALALYVAATLISAVLYHVIERPAQAAITRLWAARA
jgi:peptidoglycan/LPS O-acetylase OafA/YrhL